MQDSEQIRDGVRQNLMDKLNQVVDDVEEDEFEWAWNMEYKILIAFINFSGLSMWYFIYIL